MELEFAMGTIFAIAFVGVLAYMVFGVIRYKGFRGAMFGSELQNTIGEVEGTNSGLVHSKVRVHVLDSKNNPDKNVGLEFIATSFASYQMMPIPLSQSQTANLISYLRQAIGNKPSSKILVN